jgi:nitrogen fixation-related uncharacterized protein
LDLQKEADVLIGFILWLVWMVLEVVVVVAMIRWGFETGQWKDIEEPKYRMLIDREPEPWPGRKKSPSTDKPAEQGGKA